MPHRRVARRTGPAVAAGVAAFLVMAPGAGWFQSAAAAPRALDPPLSRPAGITRFAPALDSLVAPDARLEKIAEGFGFLEGPVWLPAGALLFSDVKANRIYRWAPPGALTVFREESGAPSALAEKLKMPGSNGLALDPQGRLTICEQGNRRVTRLEPDGRVTVLADRFEGHRFNSPNDLVWRADGSLYFTDPAFGLPGGASDPGRELPYCGVYRLKEGRLLKVFEAAAPNGLALSPGQGRLWVVEGASDRRKVSSIDVTMFSEFSPHYKAPSADAPRRYMVGEDGFDFSNAPDRDPLDGLKVDDHGNLYIAGAGGIWIFTQKGERLGRMELPEAPSNLAWGDADHRTLYITARTGLYRIRLRTRGPQPVR